MSRGDGLPSRRSRRAGSPSDARRFGIATFIAATCWFLAIGIGRWNAGRATSYDLGIFSQGAQAWARGDLPSSHIRELDLFGDHFSPVTALFGLAWRVWPDPRALIAVQALCLAATAAMVVAIAQRRLGSRWAAGIGAVALLSGGVVSAALFDVHEVAFAAPLMVGLGYGLMERRAGLCIGSSALLVLVKEDLGLTVIAAGAIWWWLERRDGRRVAAVLAAVGGAGLLIATTVIARVNPDGGSSYLGFFGVGKAKSPLAPDTVEGLFHLERLQPLVLFTLMAGLIGWRSPVAFLAIPTLLWRTASSNPNYWSLNFHYDLVLWPVAMLALIDAAPRVLGRGARTPVAVACAAAVLGNVTLGVLHLVHRAAPGSILTASATRDDLHRVASLIPDGARVAAQNRVGAYLVADHDVYMLTQSNRVAVDYVAFSTFTDRRSELPRCMRDALARTARATPGWMIWQVGRFTVIKAPSPTVPVITPCGRPDPFANG